MKENLFIMVYCIQQAVEAERDPKERNSFRYQNYNLLEMWFLFLISTKEQTIDKSEFVTKSVGIIFIYL